ncbi:hypothetical protein Emed_004147 [Eimeria media]
MAGCGSPGRLQSGALQGAVGALVPPGVGMNPAVTAITPTEEKPPIPAIDSGKIPKSEIPYDILQLISAERTAKLESMQKLLDRKIQQSQELKEKLELELKFMKDEGLLEPGKGAAALQGKFAAFSFLAFLNSRVASQVLRWSLVNKEQSFMHPTVGGMLPDLAAPIIFLEPPPVTQSQTLEAAEVAETTLAQIGDYSSPAMRAVREYELKKLGQIAGTTLKENSRALAKEGNRHLEMQAAFANADLKEKSKELDILAEKLTQLKTRERDLIRREHKRRKTSLSSQLKWRKRNETLQSSCSIKSSSSSSNSSSSSSSSSSSGQDIRLFCCLLMMHLRIMRRQSLPPAVREDSLFCMHFQ